MLDTQSKSYTAQEMADFWCKQVMMGKGQWTARLDPRGLDYRTSKDTQINLAIPTTDQMYNEDKQIVFISVRF